MNHAIAIKRSIFIMLERTKKPIIVTVGKLIEMTYESYIMVQEMDISIEALEHQTSK